MKDLLTIAVPRLAAKWEQIGYYMDFELYEIDTIKKKCQVDPEKCITELLKRWFEKGCDKSWKTFIALLNDVPKLKAVSQEIKEHLMQMSMYVHSNMLIL